MDKIKYAAVLKINDLDNMTDEESKRWNRFLQLSPTARGYVLKAIEQDIDILFCFSKESLFNRYNSHFDISVVSEYLNLQPKKVLLKGKIANYYTEQDVAILDEFMQKDKKEIAKIIQEQNSLKKYGVRNYKQTDDYRSSMSESIKEVWKRDGYKDNISEKVKKTYSSKSVVEKQSRVEHIKAARAVTESNRKENLEKKRNLLQTQLGEPVYYISEACSLFGFSWDVFTFIKKSIDCEIQVFQVENCKFLKKSDIDKVLLTIQNLTGRSKEETDLANWFKSIYNGEVKLNDRTVLGGKELDIFTPGRKLAIEFNGLYWHSDKSFLEKDQLVPSKESRRIAMQRHLDKTVSCEKQGIRLIHIFEDDWLYRQGIVKSIVKAALGIFDRKFFARKCEIVQLTNNVYKNFLLENHLQGYSPADLRLGLRTKDTKELLEIIGVNTRGTHSSEPELVRLCTKLNTQVLGGFSRLLKATSLQSMVSYIDRATFSGNGYNQVHFEVVKVNTPSYFYVKDNIRQPRYRFTRRRIETLYRRGCLDYWNPSETEELNMYKNGYARIWNCGTIKVRWSRSLIR